MNLATSQINHLTPMVDRLTPLAPVADKLNGRLLTLLIFANVATFILAALALMGVPTTMFWPILSNLIRLTGSI
jgi:hypothetical protein